MAMICIQEKKELIDLYFLFENIEDKFKIKIAYYQIADATTPISNNSLAAILNTYHYMFRLFRETLYETLPILNVDTNN